MIRLDFTPCDPSSTFQCARVRGEFDASSTTELTFSVTPRMLMIAPGKRSIVINNSSSIQPYLPIDTIQIRCGGGITVRQTAGSKTSLSEIFYSLSGEERTVSPLNEMVPQSCFGKDKESQSVVLIQENQFFSVPRQFGEAEVYFRTMENDLCMAGV